LNESVPGARIIELAMAALGIAPLPVALIDRLYPLSVCT